jgi:hypothetical protein
LFQPRAKGQLQDGETHVDYVYHLRQQHSVPLLNAFKTWLDELAPKVLPESLLLVLLPHGTGDTIAHGPAIPVQQIEARSPQYFDGGRLTLRCGEGEITAARFIGGLFRFEGSPLPSVLSALPPLIHIPRQESGAPAWLQAISHFLIDEVHEARPGAALMISRLIDLLVIRTLRTWAASRPTNLGWLGGLAEEPIRRVLSAMHAAPYRDWNVEALCKHRRYVSLDFHRALCFNCRRASIALSNTLAIDNCR